MELYSYIVPGNIYFFIFFLIFPVWIVLPDLAGISLALKSSCWSLPDVTGWREGDEGGALVERAPHGKIKEEVQTVFLLLFGVLVLFLFC